MTHDLSEHRRHPIRLEGYDYASACAYFVTICVQRHECVLDNPVVRGIVTDVWHALPAWFPTIALDEFVVMPNHVHLIVWLQSTGRDWAGVSPAPTDADHVGAALAAAPYWTGTSPALTNGDRAGASPAPTEMVTPTDWIIPRAKKVHLNPRLGDVIGTFQSLVFTVYLDWVETHDPTRQAKFWQRGYYEHVIRNEIELHAIRRYIRDNPLQWSLDRDNPANIHHLPPPVAIKDYLADITRQQE